VVVLFIAGGKFSGINFDEFGDDLIDNAFAWCVRSGSGINPL
jgi:hypothetical protein